MYVLDRVLYTQYLSLLSENSSRFYFLQVRQWRPLSSRMCVSISLYCYSLYLQKSLKILRRDTWLVFRENTANFQMQKNKKVRRRKTREWDISIKIFCQSRTIQILRYLFHKISTLIKEVEEVSTMMIWICIYFVVRFIFLYLTFINLVHALQLQVWGDFHRNLRGVVGLFFQKGLIK